MISPETQKRILKIIEDVSLWKMEDIKLDKALWDLLSNYGCIETGVKIITKNVMDGKAIGNWLAEKLVQILQSDMEYVDCIYDVFYYMNIGTETINPKLSKYCKFMKLIYDLNDQNTNSDKKIGIIKRLSHYYIDNIYPIPSRIVKSLSQVINEINDPKLTKLHYFYYLADSKLSLINQII